MRGGQFYTTADLHRLYGVKPDRSAEWCQVGAPLEGGGRFDLRPQKLGRSWLVPRARFEEYLRRNNRGRSVTLAGAEGEEGSGRPAEEAARWARDEMGVG